MGFRSFQVGEHIYVLGRWCNPTPRGQRLLCLGFSGSCPIYLFIWLFNYYTFTINCNNKYSTLLSSIVILEIIKPEKGVVEAPEFVVGQEEVRVAWGSPLWVMSEVEAGLWDWCLNLWDLC